MFFLAVIVWATLAKEPPKILGVYEHLEDCQAMAGKMRGAPMNGYLPPQRYICLQIMGDA